MDAYYQDVYDHTLRLLEQIDLHRDIVSGVMDAIMAQTNNRLNQVMKTLTVLSTMLMSASLIAGIYGMNFRYMPELQWRYGYFGALGIMAGVVVGLGVYFKRIGWI
jgi:magnesium transporter